MGATRMTKSFKPTFTISNRITAGLTRVERARGFLEAATLSEAWVREMGRRALILEAHHTTHIEGTRLTLDQAERLLAGNPVPEADPDDVRELLNYRKAFDNFDPEQIAEYDAKKIASLLENPGIIRNRLKVNSTVINAQKFLEVVAEFGSFDAYIWQFVNGKPIVNKLRNMEDYAATTPESELMCKDMRKRGFKFVGSTICYAHMQATGMVNDHTIDCFRRQQIIDSYPI